MKVRNPVRIGVIAAVIVATSLGTAFGVNALVRGDGDITPPRTAIVSNDGPATEPTEPTEAAAPVETSPATPSAPGEQPADPTPPAPDTPESPIPTADETPQVMSVTVGPPTPLPTKSMEASPPAPSEYSINVVMQ